MYKKVLLLILFISCISLISSCSNSESDSNNMFFQNEYGRVQFSFASKPTANIYSSGISNNLLPHLFSNQTEASTESLQSIMLTVENEEGIIIYNKKVLTLIKFGDSYITESLSFKTGSYKLVEFFVLNDSNEVEYAAPLNGSSQAAYVSNPLPIEIVITKDVDVQVTPQVLSVDGHVSEDFGYASFSFEIVDRPIEMNNISVSNLTCDSVTIKWNTNIASDCTLDFGETDGYGTTVSAEKSSDGLSHEVIITGELNANTLYHYKINADTTVNGYKYTESEDIVFSTNAADAVKIENTTVTAITYNSVSIKWETDVASKCKFKYGFDNTYGTIIDTQSSSDGLSHEVTIDGVLNASTEYHYSITASPEVAGYISSDSIDSTFSTLDKKLITMSDIKATSITYDSATISLKTNTPTQCTLHYGLTDSYGSTAEMTKSADGLSYQVVLEEVLTSGQTYHYKVVAVPDDNSYNTAESTDNIFTSANLNSLEINNINITSLTYNSIKITWQTNANAECTFSYGETTSYGNNITATADANGINHSIEVNGSLGSNTLYHYKIKGTPKAGGYTTAVTDDTTFTTNDQQSVQINEIIVSEITENRAKITLKTDISSNCILYYGKTDTYGESISFSSSDNLNHSVNLTGLDAETEYNFKVAASPTVSGYKSSESGNQSFSTIAEGGSSTAKMLKSTYYDSSNNITGYYLYEYNSDGFADKNLYYDDANTLIAYNTYTYVSPGIIEKMEYVTNGSLYYYYNYEYTDNKITKMTGYDKDDTHFATTTREYDGDGKLIKMNIDSYSGGNIYTSYFIYEYDLQNRVSKELYYNYNDDLTSYNIMEYNDKNQKIKDTQYNSSNEVYQYSLFEYEE